MTESPAHGSGWVGRTGYALIAAVWAAFVAYGSMVPFSYRNVSFAEGLQRFSRTVNESVFIDSRTDFVTNILLAIPLGYLVLAALRTDRRGRLGHLATAVAVVPACWLYSVVVEFSQEFFSGRTASASDIVAQFGGAVVGVIGWLVVGNGLTDWLRASLKERERPAIVQRLVVGYCVILAISQVMPLDLTLNLGQLARKFRSGGVLLVPFSYPYATGFDRFWDYFGDVLLNVPVGIAATLLWTHNGARRRPGRALILAVCGVGAIEVAQVFVRSRIAATTDVITGSFGAALGVLLVGAVSDRQVARREANHSLLSRLGLVGVLLSSVFLISYHWAPYDFTTDPERVTVGMRQLLSVPFGSYYTGSEFKALTEMLRKLVLALPLGVSLRLAVLPLQAPRRRRLPTIVVAVAGFLILFLVELGQVFLPTRFADVTDVLVAEGGVLLGSWIAAWLVSASAEGAGHEVRLKPDATES